MTDRVNAFVVILDRDIREDDVEATINAINQIKGVLEVIPQTSEPIHAAVMRSRLKAELFSKLTEMIKET